MNIKELALSWPRGESAGWWVAVAADLLILTGAVWRSEESGARRKPPGVL